jgi:hypothetical protein
MRRAKTGIGFTYSQHAGSSKTWYTKMASSDDDIHTHLGALRSAMRMNWVRGANGIARSCGDLAWSVGGKYAPPASTAEASSTRVMPRMRFCPEALRNDVV